MLFLFHSFQSFIFTHFTLLSSFISAFTANVRKGDIA